MSVWLSGEKDTSHVCECLEKFDLVKMAPDEPHFSVSPFCLPELVPVQPEWVQLAIFFHSPVVSLTSLSSHRSDHSAHCLMMCPGPPMRRALWQQHSLSRHRATLMFLGRTVSAAGGVPSHLHSSQYINSA